MEFLRPPLVLVYRDRYQWWASVELGRRFLLLLLTISFPQNQVWGILSGRTPSRNTRTPL